MKTPGSIPPDSAPSETPATRDPFLDNAKFLLIVLVVVGHNWVPALDDFRGLKAAYIVVYTFHVPAFVLLCGYFSRGFEGRHDQWRKLVVTTLVPYLIFQSAYAALTAVLSGRPFQLHLSSPIYVCWFLLALFVWRAAAPLLRSLPHPILLSVGVSLAASVTVVDTGFALSRTLQLLPWFVAGLLLEPRHFLLLRRRWIRVCAAVTLVLAAGGAVLIAPFVDVRWLDREWDAERLGVSAPLDLAFAAGLDLVTAVMVIAVLALVPRGTTRLTRLGALTMYPFLLHGLIVRILQHVGMHRFLITLGPAGVAAITAVAVLLAILLTTPVVRIATGWAVEPADLLAHLQARRRRPGKPSGGDPGGPAAHDPDSAQTIRSDVPTRAAAAPPS